MKIYSFGDADIPLSLTMAAVGQLDALRPSCSLRQLAGLTETTTGILDLAQAMSQMDRDQLAAVLLRHLDQLPNFREVLLDETAASMYTETGSGRDGEEVDVTLQQILAEKGGGSMTFRRLVSMGLIAGLDWQQMMPLTPGAVCDLYLYRMRYDDEQHGIVRKKQQFDD